MDDSEDLISQASCQASCYLTVRIKMYWTKIPVFRDKVFSDTLIYHGALSARPGFLQSRSTFYPWLITDNQMQIRNQSHGHTPGGGAFEFLNPEDASRVISLQVWTHPEGGHEVLRGIKVSWDSGLSMSCGTTSGDFQSEAKFTKHERIIEMIIWAGDWVDGISYKSTRNLQGKRLGGPGGSPHVQHCGNGILLGFHGMSGSMVDALGSIFEIQRNLLLPSPEPKNNHGGIEFIAQHTDHRSRVKSIHVWTEWDGADHLVLRGIEVQWSSGHLYECGSCVGTAYDSAEFQESERITEFAIWAGSWVDAISYKSNLVRDGKKLGGPGGAKHQQNVGSGILVGLKGRAGNRIDSLGPIFVS
ncbi:uncharacterized protein F4812DRAFT_204019 [Daldinia caldariorum]|uniref:uncharacterized protein n=1 Tax=Daldinia caldariorum TaxID=326644 RepID=UPI0020087911|nr:uncharacterized protein F4812DRAFT_204019 [Daldinia caldariorum]KAI1472065.1 hypothetical protein F4812DRAFT_204019 [Daldinia caldariorum]